MADRTVSEWRPPEGVLDFVAWKLQIAMDSFYGQILQLVPHADRQNLAVLRQAFPPIVEAWEAWQASDGDFELPPSAVEFVRGKHVS